MNILSIDPGIERTGYAILKLNNDSCTLIKADCIITKKNIPIDQRLYSIQERVEDILNKENIDLIIMEDLFFFKNQKTVISVARSQGVMLSLAGKYKKNVIFLTPLQIKSIVTGYGRADKKSMQKMISYFFPNLKNNLLDDTIDAIACGYAFYISNYSSFKI